MKENLEGATKHLSSLAEERAKEAWEWKKEMQELNKVLMWLHMIKPALFLEHVSVEKLEKLENLANCFLL